MPLSMTEQAHGSASVLALSGEIDVAVGEQLKQRLLDLVGAAPPLLVVDLSGVGFMDSTGLWALAAARKRARAGNTRVVLVVGGSQVLRLLQISGMDRLFTIAPTQTEALAAGTG